MVGLQWRVCVGCGYASPVSGCRGRVGQEKRWDNERAGVGVATPKMVLAVRSPKTALAVQMAGAKSTDQINLRALPLSSRRASLPGRGSFTEASSQRARTLSCGNARDGEDQTETRVEGEKGGARSHNVSRRAHKRHASAIVPLTSTVMARWPSLTMNDARLGSGTGARLGFRVDPPFNGLR